MSISGATLVVIYLLLLISNMSLNEVICVNDDSGKVIMVLAARSSSLFSMMSRVSGNPEEFVFLLIVVL